MQNPTFQVKRGYLEFPSQNIKAKPLLGSLWSYNCIYALLELGSKSVYIEEETECKVESQN